MNIAKLTQAAAVDILPKVSGKRHLYHTLSVTYHRHIVILRFVFLFHSQYPIFHASTPSNIFAIYGAIIVGNTKQFDAHTVILIGTLKRSSPVKRI